MELQPSRSGTSPAPPNPLEGTEWRLAACLGPDGTGVEVPGEIMATATFAGGIVAGSTGCNRYRAAYAVEGRRLTVEAAAMTMMACDPERTAVERAFTAALAVTSTFAISGDVLDLAGADGRVLLRFRAAPALPLVGTPWVATGVNNGRGGVASVIEGVEVTATFGDDGRVAGSGGCNRFVGPFTLDGDRLSVGPLVTTRMACSEPEGIGEQEGAFLAALGRVEVWSIREGRLELRDAAGALQVELRPVR